MRNIPRCREEYTFCSKGIYLFAEGYILFARRVYTFLLKGIYYLLKGIYPLLLTSIMRRAPHTPSRRERYAGHAESSGVGGLEIGCLAKLFAGDAEKLCITTEARD